MVSDQALLRIRGEAQRPTSVADTRLARPSVFSQSLLLIAFALLLLIALPSVAADGERERIIVTGEGSVAVAPDMAVVQMTVTREGKTAREALSENSAAMRKVLDAMSKEGIAKSDLQTANFSISPNYTRPSRNASDYEAPRIVGYTVRNGLTVRVRDMAKVGEVLDRAVTLGVNEGGHIQFTNADTAAVMEKARIAAVKQARRKAQTLAEAAGVSVGSVLEISEQGYNPGPVAMGYAEMRMASADAVPVEGGENTYRVTVSLTYAIKQ